MAHVTSSGLRIHYAEAGAGTALLLLTGLGADIPSWGPLLPALAQRHRVIAVDNRGTGGSELGGGRFAVADMADDAVAVLDAAGAASVHLVGNSLGGMIAQELALRHPQRVRSLVLAAASPGIPCVPFRPALAWHLLRATRGDPAARLGHLAAAFCGPVSRVDHPARLGGGALELPAGSALRRQLAAALRWSSLRRLGRIAVPTLVLHGTHDRLVPALNARLMVRLIPGARLRLLERTGHFFISDAADEALAAIAGFIDEVERTPVLSLPAAAPEPLLPAAVPVVLGPSSR